MHLSGALRPATRQSVQASLWALCIVGLAACDQQTSESKPAAPPPPTVVVADVTKESVPLDRDFVGNTAAIKAVDVRARVEGYLEERRFTEGSDVKKGDVLFIIDQRPFKADVAQAEADLKQKKSSLAFANKQVERYRPLVEKADVSKQQFEGIETQARNAKAAVEASEAALKTAQLNLDYSTIHAPIDGRIGRTLVNIGNLVSAEDTMLTTLVQLDPIYAYFSPSESQFLELLKYQSQDSPLKVSMRLVDETAYGHVGTLDFIDNTVDSSTGTITLRAIFPNPDKTLRPGQYAQVRVHLADQVDTVVVPAPAVGEDEGGTYVFVVDKDDKVEQRRVKLGPDYKTGRVVSDGLKAGEKVIVEGLQKVHGGQIVKVQTAKK